MTTADWALVISLVSVLIALGSFIWNVWSKFIYPKPKVRASFSVMNIHQSGEVSPPFLVLSATNYGPGEVTLHAAVAAPKRRFWQRLLRRSRSIGILNPLENFPMQTNHSVGPFGGGLPKKISVGEQFSLYFTFKHEGLRDDGLVDVGVTDTFGRYHWSRRKDVREVIERIRKDFPKEVTE